MSSLYVDRRGVSLKADGEALAFYENGERVGTVPLAPLERVFLRGDVTLQSSLLGKLGERGIGVVVLSGRKGLPSLMLAQPHKDAARRIAQYQLAQNHDFCLTFSLAAIELKIQAQRDLLLSLRESKHEFRYELSHYARELDGFLQALARQNSLASIRGVEGAAAAAYFAALACALPPSLKFKGRNRRPPRDPFNAVLSLSYTLLHSEAVLALFGAGLDPFIGFFHGIEYGRESLACDVIEPLRPLIDQWLIHCFRKEVLKPEDFSTTAEGCMLGKAGRVRFYGAYDLASELWRKRLTESIRDLAHVIRSTPLPKMPQGRVAIHIPDEEFEEIADWPDDLRGDT